MGSLREEVLPVQTNPHREHILNDTACGILTQMGEMHSLSVLKKCSYMCFQIFDENAVRKGKGPLSVRHRIKLPFHLDPFNPYSLQEFVFQLNPHRKL